MKILPTLLVSSALLLAEESFSDFQNEFQNSIKQEKEDFQKYKEENEREFQQFKAELEAEYKQYKKLLDAEFKQYKKELSQYWEDPKTSSAHIWVEYSEDKKRRKIIDFEKGEIRIEIISKKNRDEVEKQLLADTVVIMAESPETAIKKDVVTQKVEEKFKKITKQEVAKSKVEKTPFLADLVAPNTTVREKIKIAKEMKSETKAESSKKVSGAKVYSTVIKLPKNFPVKRASKFRKDANKYAKEFKIESALVFAIMHSESSFNPMAKSHIPAYGLMQVVPRSAGIDAYYMVYKKKRVLPGSYLFNSTQNIEMGTAYLHILYYRYLKSITNPESRLYATIAAYNTGAGNVAKAFTGKTNIRVASRTINKMSPEEVKEKLLKDLPWDETKHYLEKVSKRYEIYKSAGY
ncbi:soluble lytic murein transglycosylase-like protein [Thiovulum sp. ES]|nr:soluble lytic murein transglycosylase-like protein [Thiovulum sp. ES]